MRYAHGRRLVHRALSPRAVIVEEGDGRPTLRVGEWQTAARGLSSSSTRHRVVPTSHAGRHVENSAHAYLAPEFDEDTDGTSAIDVFGLGSTAYLLLTGRAPAATRAELLARLLAENGLRPSAVDDSIPDDLDRLVRGATAPQVAGSPASRTSSSGSTCASPACGPPCIPRPSRTPTRRHRTTSCPTAPMCCGSWGPAPRPRPCSSVGGTRAPPC